MSTAGSVPTTHASWPRLQDDDGRRHELEGAAVRVCPLHVTAREKADVGVLARRRPGDSLHVARPAEAGGVHDAAHPYAAGADDVELDPADLPVVGGTDGSEERIHHDLPAGVLIPSKAAAALRESGCPAPIRRRRHIS